MALSPPLHPPGRLLAGLERAGLRAAAADVAVQRLLDLVAGGVGILLEAGDARDDEARRAEPAHQAVALDELLLQRVELAVRAQALDRADLLPLRLDGERRAGVDGPAADDHRA